MKTMFLHPPSFDGFDGGAGARYQAKREIRSFWYPTWLAQPAALVPDSQLLDAPAEGLGMAEVLERAAGFDLIIMHTSSPSFPKDARVAELLKGENPALLIGMVGAKVAVDPHGSLTASEAIDGALNSAVRSNEWPNSASISVSIPTASSECPPRSKKFVFRLIRSRPRSLAQMRASFSSIEPAGAS